MERWKTILIQKNQWQNMKYYNLQYYVDKLKNGERFSLARYGDGEFYCMWGKGTENSNGCRYSPELREALLGSMKWQDDPSFIYGMQRVLPHDARRIEDQFPGIDWHDSEIFGEAVAEGKLFPLIEQLRKMTVVIIGNETLKPVEIILGAKEFIKVPKYNTFDFPPKFPIYENAVYLFSCGMAANAFIAEFHGINNNWYLDMGHIWDPFVGNMSRCDLEGKTMEDIKKNLIQW